MREVKQIGTIAYMGGIMSLPEPFTWSWGNMLAFTQEALCQPDERIHIGRTKLSLHAYARNELISTMRGDWILMLDTDVCFPPDLAARLVAKMAKYDADVVTGIYCYKKPPHFPVLYIHNADTDRHEIVSNWDHARDVFPVDSAGAGCLLIRRRVFERITRELNENPFDMLPGKGEDHSFFIRCRKLGIKVLCAWQVEMQHLEYFGVTPSEHYHPEETAPDHEFEMQYAPA